MTNLKNLLLENYSKYFDDLLSGERSLPFGLHVVFIFFVPTVSGFMQKSLDEFKYRPGPTTDLRASDKFYVVATLVPRDLIGSSSYLKTFRTTIKD